MNAVAYSILVIKLVKQQGKNSVLARAIGKDKKGNISILIYAVGIAFSWVNSTISFSLYAIVACIWFIPDKRIEKKIVDQPK